MRLTQKNTLPIKKECTDFSLMNKYTDADHMFLFGVNLKSKKFFFQI